MVHELNFKSLIELINGYINKINEEKDIEDKVREFVSIENRQTNKVIYSIYNDVAIKNFEENIRGIVRIIITKYIQKKYPNVKIDHHYIADLIINKKEELTEDVFLDMIMKKILNNNPEETSKKELFQKLNTLFERKKSQFENYLDKEFREKNKITLSIYIHKDYKNRSSINDKSPIDALGKILNYYLNKIPYLVAQDNIFDIKNKIDNQFEKILINNSKIIGLKIFKNSKVELTCKNETIATEILEFLNQESQAILT